jgi:molybdopterin synthase sulfur carrier subunit
MSKVRIPQPLRKYAEGQKAIESRGETAGAALRELTSKYPQLADFIFLDAKSLQLSIHVFLNETEIRSLQGLDTPLAPEDTLILVMGISGG